MPTRTPRRPVRSSSIVGLTSAKETQLLMGWNYFHEVGGYPEVEATAENPTAERFTAETLAEMKRDWFFWRDSLLRNFDSGSRKAWAMEQFE